MKKPWIEIDRRFRKIELQTGGLVGPEVLGQLRFSKKRIAYAIESEFAKQSSQFAGRPRAESRHSRFDTEGVDCRGGRCGFHPSLNKRDQRSKAP